MLGKPCYRVVVAGFVMGCNCSWNVVCVCILGLAKLRKAETRGGRTAINEQCQSLGFVIVMPREAGPLVVNW